MPDVLSAVEHPEGQSREEVSGREVSGDGANLEARLPLQVLVDVVQLRDGVRTGMKLRVTYLSN